MVLDMLRGLDPRNLRRRQLESSPNYVGTGPRSPVQGRPQGGSPAGAQPLDPARLLELGGQINQNIPQGSLDELAAALGAQGGPGGGGPDHSGTIAGSYDAEIAALRGAGGKMAGLTGDLIGNIDSSAAGANQQIGGFFGYAGDQARAGRPVIEESYGTARTNVDQTYDQLAAQLAGLPQATADQARAAGGDAAGSSVADRVAVAAAPFAAAGEGARAASQANLQQHSTAGQDYLTQLASAAPSEAAQSQAAVTGRANMAVTSAQMALAEQQSQIELQVARTEGAKQRALAEYAADSAGDTFGRAKDLLDLEFRENQIKMQEQELAGGGEYDPTQGSGYEAFDAALRGSDPGTQQFGQDLLPYLSQDSVTPGGADLNYEHLIGALRGPSGVQMGPGGGKLGARTSGQVGGDTAETLNELVEQILSGGAGPEGDRDPQMRLPQGVDREALRRAFRQQVG